MRRQRLLAGVAPAIGAILILITAACGDDGEDIAAGAAATGGDAVTAITSLATDNKFDQTAYTVKAGQEITLTLENKGQALHNWHVKTKGKDGKEITTQLLPGNQSETIKFTVDKAGTYDFLCDVHPVEMVGKLIVR